ncbi:MAG: nucleotide exchange factor GrpE [Verrucomicrobiota bacterium]|nr:nucleotide exchange factor GrpE [Verrucomicrobiota bacterium]
MGDDFTATMRELSASATVREQPRATSQELAAMMREFQSVNASLQSLESVLTRRVENIASIILPAHATEAAAQFKRVEDQLQSIRASETVNQRLFDSLHDELLKYRDNFLHESLHKPFVRDLIVLFDDLSGLADQLKTAAKADAKRDRVARWRDNLDNAIHALVEILHRLEVTEVEAKEFVDLTMHKVVSFEPTEFAEDDGRIVMRVKRGFVWRGNVVRPEEVIAKRYQ